AQITAQSYYKMGKKFKLSKLIFSPIFSFIKDYIVRQGFRDGIQGFIVGVSAPIYVFLKYAYLWEIYHDKENKS
ncbi:MAG: glycosyltransferase family 2 protein, partial [Campylobacterales bacterium]|nr:glycosyltransferase family 2 protein [Campylobacterales bacterium]